MEASGMTSGQTVMEDMGLSDDDGRRSFEALKTAGYIEVEGWGANGLPFIVKPTGLGLQHCSGWPAPGGESVFVAQFLTAIDARANDTSVPAEERSRLKKLLDAAGAVGKDVLTEVTAKVLSP
jgi:hypothetical protein